MNKDIKTILIAALLAGLVSGIVVSIALMLVGNQSASLGGSGITRMPNSGMAMKYIHLTNSPATSSAIADASLLVDGTSTFTGAITISGAATLSSTNTITGTSTFSAGLYGTGAVRLKRPVITGASTTLTAGATASITAAQACSNGLINFNPTALTVGSTTLPAAEDVFATTGCLTTNGDRTTFIFRNLSAATTTQFAIGSASTTMLIAENTGADNTIAASGWARVELQRNADNLMTAIIEELVAP